MNTALANHGDILAARDGDVAALRRARSRSRQSLRRHAEYHRNINDAHDAAQESQPLVSGRLRDPRLPEAHAPWVFRLLKRGCRP